MKNIGLLFATIALVASIQAQTNTFPASGSVGIGTATPVAHLEIQLNATNLIKFDGGGGSTNGNFLFEQSTDYRDSFPLVAFTTNDSNTARANTLVRIHSNETSAGAIPFEVTSQGTLASPTYTALAVNYIGNVGIGTATPVAHLEIQRNATNLIKFDGGGGFTNGNFLFEQSTDYSDSFPLVAFTTNDSNTARANTLVRIHSNETSAGAIPFEVTSQGTLASPTYTALAVNYIGNVGIGTTNPGCALDVPNGTIHAQGVIVDTSGADYVFKPDYKLASLSEVEGVIKREGHLPGIPSAQEMSARGVSVGDLQAKLLAKVEELTLHQIEQERLLAAQQTEIATLKAEVVRLEKP